MKRALTRLCVLMFGIAGALGGSLAFTSAATAEAPFDVVVMTWLPSAASCEKLPATDCAVAEDGWTLAIVDPAVTNFGGEDCLDLPKDHGKFVAYRSGVWDRATHPDAVAELGTGTCAAPIFDELDAVPAGLRRTLPHPVDGVVKHEAHHGFSGKATFYVPGRGACGKASGAGELVVALPASIYDSPSRNQNCGRKMRVTRGSRSVVVTVVDRCAGCGYGDPDLSLAAFKQIARPSEGRVAMTWSFVS